MKLQQILWLNSPRTNMMLLLALTFSFDASDAFESKSFILSSTGMTWSSEAARAPDSIWADIIFTWVLYWCWTDLLILNISFRVSSFPWRVSKSLHESQNLVETLKIEIMIEWLTRNLSNYIEKLMNFLFFSSLHNSTEIYSQVRLAQNGKTRNYLSPKIFRQINSW